jgi:hypothetical protein
MNKPVLHIRKGWPRGQRPDRLNSHPNHIIWAFFTIESKKWYNIPHTIYERIQTQTIHELIFENVFVNFIEICYYPGFYSSLRDEMGQKGDIFKTMYNFKKTLMKSNKFDIIMRYLK